MTYDIEEIISRYKDEYGYVSDIESVITFLKNDKTLTKSDINSVLVKIIEWNLKVDSENKQSLQETKKVKKRIETKLEEKEKKEEQLKKDSSLIDVSSYIQSLKQCDDDDFLTELLPSIYDNNYESIIGAILLYFLREIALAYEMLHEETEKDGIEYLQHIIKRDKEIMEIIKEYNKKEEQIETVEVTDKKENNKLVFLKKNGKPFIESDIDDISIEDDILPILNDIITGNFTREKRFHSSNELKGISAIRRRDSRIIFARLDSKTILILGIFVKRFQNPQTYRDMLSSRNKIYKLEKESLKERILDEDFMQENEEIKQNVIEKLKSRRKLLSEVE